MGVESQLRALAEPTRRAIFELVADRELAAGDIARRFDVTRPAISQHIRVLKDAGLLAERRDGVRRLYSADLAGLVGLKQFVDRFWSVGLSNLKAAAEREFASLERPDPIG
jgi:DNA-binding transcriptional ArsR family regulator